MVLSLRKKRKWLAALMVISLMVGSAYFGVNALKAYYYPQSYSDYPESVKFKRSRIAA